MFSPRTCYDKRENRRGGRLYAPKNLHITDYTPEKLTAVLDEVTALPAYKTAGQMLLLLLEQNWDPASIREKLGSIRRRLPRAEVAGTTHFDRFLEGEGDLGNNTILTFLFFRRPSVLLRRYAIGELRDEEIGHRLRLALRETQEPKCLMTLFASRPRDISYILSLAAEPSSDLPIFGAAAAVEGFSREHPGGSWVLDGEGCWADVLLSLVLYGEELHVKASYNFGWTQVGRIMTVTKLTDPFTVAEIDRRPAAELYERYLGVPYRKNRLSIANICEFSLTVGREMQMARIPYAWTEDGELKFAVTVHEGERVRLSYGLPRQIFSQIARDAEDFRAFAPEGMLMVICMNRMLFLRDAEHWETDAYRALAPDAAFLHGNSEIFYRRGQGGEMHSALIAVGFREGPAAPETLPTAGACPAEAAPAGDQVIPLENRLMTFLRAVTSDLEQTTAELVHLKENLEQEVERKTRENERLSLRVVQALAEAIDAKDSYTKGHSGRVAAYSREIARRAGFPEKAQDELYMMGLLHDVGKIGIPDSVINKPGKLTEEEYAQIKVHPVMGARILRTIQEMPRLTIGARWHHERYDGRGYPDGLSGTDIPKEARIIAVADTYDAMSSNRSYRRSMTQAEVRAQIESGKGTQLDPEYADILLGMMDEDTKVETL